MINEFRSPTYKNSFNLHKSKILPKKWVIQFRVISLTSVSSVSTFRKILEWPIHKPPLPEGPNNRNWSLSQAWMSGPPVRNWSGPLVRNSGPSFFGPVGRSGIPDRDNLVRTNIFLVWSGHPCWRRRTSYSLCWYLPGMSGSMMTHQSFLLDCISLRWTNWVTIKVILGENM